MTRKLHRHLATISLLLCLFFQTIWAQPSSLQPAPQSAPQAAPQTTPVETYETLAARIAAHLAQPRFSPVAWGVKVVSLDSGKIIFERNPEKYFNPASNAKLYTGALALDTFGADYKIK